MASANIRVSGRLFKLVLREYENSSGYKCMFHEKHEAFGRTWGFRNKNFASREREEVYNWFKHMVETHTPNDESEEVVLEEVVTKLNEEHEQVSVE